MLRIEISSLLFLHDGIWINLNQYDWANMLVKKKNVDRVKAAGIAAKVYKDNKQDATSAKLEQLRNLANKLDTTKKYQIAAKEKYFYQN